MPDDRQGAEVAIGPQQGKHYSRVLGRILPSILDMPRPALVRLTAHLIDYLDMNDDDPDCEDGDPDEEHDEREPDDYI